MQDTSQSPASQSPSQALSHTPTNTPAVSSTGVTTGTPARTSTGTPTSAFSKGAKARHRWSREVSTVEFHVDAFDSKATVAWRKRNEMVIRRGAVMRRDAPLNKDGSVGFSARFSQSIRAEHSGEYEDYVTTADIVLKSVNEVGLFLYFGGTNGWLVLHDDQGRTIHDWTVVG